MVFSFIVISGSVPSHLSLKTQVIPGTPSSSHCPNPISCTHTGQLGLMQVAGDQALRTKEQEVSLPDGSWAMAAGTQAPVDILSSVNLGG